MKMRNIVFFGLLFAAFLCGCDGYVDPTQSFCIQAQKCSTNVSNPDADVASQIQSCQEKFQRPEGDPCHYEYNEYFTCASNLECKYFYDINSNTDKCVEENMRLFNCQLKHVFN